LLLAVLLWGHLQQGLSKQGKELALELGVGAYFTTASHGTVIGFASPVIESIPGEKSSPRNGKGYRVRIRLHFGKPRTSHPSMPLPLFVTPWDLMIQGQNQNLFSGYWWIYSYY